MNRRCVVFRRVDGLYDWHLVAPNGQIVATSGSQGYTERNDAVEAAAREFPEYEITIDGMDE